MILNSFVNGTDICGIFGDVRKLECKDFMTTKVMFWVEVELEIEMEEVEGIYGNLSGINLSLDWKFLLQFQSICLKICEI